jgi:hypothetical protein
VRPSGCWSTLLHAAAAAVMALLLDAARAQFMRTRAYGSRARAILAQAVPAAWPRPFGSTPCWRHTAGAVRAPELRQLWRVTCATHQHRNSESDTPPTDAQLRGRTCCV